LSTPRATLFPYTTLFRSPQPGVGDVITRRQILAEDGFGFVGFVAQNSGAADDPALDFVDFDGAGISGRHWRDVGNQFGFIERPRSEEHTSELQSLAYLVC